MCTQVYDRSVKYPCDFVSGIMAVHQSLSQKAKPMVQITQLSFALKNKGFWLVISASVMMCTIILPLPSIPMTMKLENGVTLQLQC